MGISLAVFIVGFFAQPLSCHAGHEGRYAEKANFRVRLSRLGSNGFIGMNSHPCRAESKGLADAPGVRQRHTDGEHE